jgi:quercetin dioxygenase-like cupin family protein
MSPPEAAAGGLSAEALAAIGFGFVADGSGDWSPLPYGSFEVRSLGLAEASDSVLAAHQLRGAPEADPAWGTCVSELEALYVRGGSLTIERPDGERHELGVGDVIMRRRGAVSRIVAAEDLDAVWMAVNGDAESEPAWDPVEWPGGIRFSFESAEAHQLGAGPRPEVIYRDIGTATATAGAYRLQVVTSPQPQRGMSIWHFHDMAQWFVVLGGWARIEVVGEEPLEVRAGDSLCIGIGEGMAHNVADIGEGFRILELCTPAEYQTWDAPQAGGGDA